MRRCVWIGTEGRRLDLFRTAIEESEYGRAFDGLVVVPFQHLIRETVELRDVVKEGDVIRIESPGKDFELERDILRLGIGGVRNVCASNVTANFAASDAVSRSFREIRESELDALEFDRGLILSQKQWYYGWCRLLRMVESQLNNCAPHSVMNSAPEIELLFDKIRCHKVFQLAGIKTSTLLGAVESFDHLISMMDENECNRVFVKPAHSSSASGIVALERNRRRQIATTTVEMVSRDGQIYLYNSRRVRKVSDLNEIRILINHLSQHNLFAEKWYPKAGLNGKTFDMRVLTVAGECRHVVVRESLTPFTNLHLLNGRGQVKAARKAMGEKLWGEVMESCRRVASAFPNCLYLGIDVLIGADMRSHVVAEANAFGDLLPGILCDGLSTYEWELEALGALSQEATINA